MLASCVIYRHIKVRDLQKAFGMVQLYSISRTASGPLQAIILFLVDANLFPSDTVCLERQATENHNNPVNYICRVCGTRERDISRMPHPKIYSTGFQQPSLLVTLLLSYGVTPRPRASVSVSSFYYRVFLCACGKRKRRLWQKGCGCTSSVNRSFIR